MQPIVSKNKSKSQIAECERTLKLSMDQWNNNMEIIMNENMLLSYPSDTDCESVEKLIWNVAGNFLVNSCIY